MSKDKKEPNPSCCGEPSKWVDHGHRLQYFYCTKCKKEVDKPQDKKEDNNDYGSGVWGFNGALTTPPGQYNPVPLGHNTAIGNVASGQIRVNYHKTPPVAQLPLDRRSELSLKGVSMCQGYMHVFVLEQSNATCNCGDRYYP